jgi:hypothetical protein
MVVEQVEGGAAKDVGLQPLLSVLVLEGLVPVGRGEVEDSVSFGQGNFSARADARRGPRSDARA